VETLDDAVGLRTPGLGLGVVDVLDSQIEHINLTGDYVWSPGREMSENRAGFLPLRPVPDPALMAA
jgi:hypothetical protein